MDSSYANRQCAFRSFHQELPCWGRVVTVDVLHLQDNIDVFVHVCMGHHMMWNDGLYCVRNRDNEFDDEPSDLS